MCTYIYVYLQCIYIYIYALYIYSHIDICIEIDLNTIEVCIERDTQISNIIHIERKYMYNNIYTYIGVRNQHIHTVPTPKKPINMETSNGPAGCAKPLNVCMYVCMCVCICMHVCVYVCMCVMQVCLYVCMYDCVYVCMYVCMHVCMYV